MVETNSCFNDKDAAIEWNCYVYEVYLRCYANFWKNHCKKDIISQFEARYLTKNNTNEIFCCPPPLDIHSGVTRHLPGKKSSAVLGEIFITFTYWPLKTVKYKFLITSSLHRLNDRGPSSRLSQRDCPSKECSNKE